VKYPQYVVFPVIFYTGILRVVSSAHAGTNPALTAMLCEMAWETAAP
jgi:hypothetical protein